MENIAATSVSQLIYHDAMPWPPQVLEDETHVPAVIAMPSWIADVADLTAWLRAARESLLDLLTCRGAILLRACPIAGPGEFEALCRAVTPDLLDYRGGGALRSIVAGKVYNSTEYAADQPIPLHCEATYYKDIPDFIWFYCDLPSTAGGETPVGDMAAVLERLDPALVERFSRRGLKYIYNMHGGDGFGRSWMDAFHTADRAVVEDWLSARGIEFRWNDRLSLHVELDAPVIRTHPVTGAKIWGNQAANWHVASLPAATALAVRRFYRSEADYPKHVLFGDGEPIPDGDIRQILDTLATAEMATPWRKGDVLLCDNHRMAHGRRPFAGDRRVLVAMA